jgi:hypothetical protein
MVGSSRVIENPAHRRQAATNRSASARRCIKLSRLLLVRSVQARWPQFLGDPGHLCELLARFFGLKAPFGAGRRGRSRARNA